MVKSSVYITGNGLRMVRSGLVELVRIGELRQWLYQWSGSIGFRLGITGEWIVRGRIGIGKLSRRRVCEGVGCEGR